MRRSRVVLLLVLFLVAAAPGFSVVDEGRGVPHMRAVLPDTAKPGDLVVVSGDYLDRPIGGVYLTTDDMEVKVEVLERSANTIKFKVPANIAPGRYRLAYLTAGVEPMFLLQPVWLAVR